MVFKYIAHELAFGWSCDYRWMTVGWSRAGPWFRIGEGCCATTRTRDARHEWMYAYDTHIRPASPFFSLLADDGGCVRWNAPNCWATLQPRPQRSLCFPHRFSFSYGRCFFFSLVCFLFLWWAWFEYMPRSNEHFICYQSSFSVESALLAGEESLNVVLCIFVCLSHSTWLWWLSKRP